MHKWLNAPYDCSVALTAHPDAHRAAMATAAAYLTPGEHREPIDWNPEMSRRARAVPTWAILRSLGRDGVEDHGRPLLRPGPTGGRAGSPPPTGSRCSTTSSSTRSWSASATTTRPPAT